MIWETIKIALREIRRNAMRSSLTILGIVIGVASVIIMVTLGGGATAQVTNEISSLGSNLIQVMPGQGPRGPGGTRSTAKNFELDDTEAISQEISGLSGVAPGASQTVQAIYGNENWSTIVIGSTNEYLKVRSWALDTGRVFTDGEIRAGRAVCILGSKVREELFGGQDPLGASIRLEKLSCEVIGVFQSKGQSSMGRDQDDFILVPLRAFQRRIAGNNDVGTIYISAQDGVSIDKLKGSITQLMRERRRIKPDEDDDFHVMDMQQITSALTGTTRTLTMLLGAVAAISLLVGGIGIMNIMLVSVTERTREVGIRLAIGALEREVLMQFLIEAVVLSSFGGIFGVVFGLVAAYFFSQSLALPFIFNMGIVVIAFLFSAVVGVIFGYFPAQKAARLDPIESLRNE